MAIADVPVLETERLVLRGHTAGDWDDVHATWAHPAVYERLSGKPSTREESWGRLLRYRGLWPLLGYGYWAVCERAGGAFVGDVGLADFQRAIEPSIAGFPEIGWVLAPTKHGRGYATEAARAVLRWAEAQALAPKAVCIIDRTNVASLRIAAKLAFRATGEGSYHGSSCVILERALR
jgi:RimJ/RimL family protein N-acetyltransferase